MDLVTVYCVFGNEEEARRIGRLVVEERLAACVNLLAPCRSFYHWNGKVEEGSEWPALFKTTREKCEGLVARLGQLHSYDVPAIVAWPIEQAHRPYAEWVTTETSE